MNLDPKNELTVLVGATRYYMGRMTYAVSDFCDFLCENWHQISDRTRAIIQRDLENEFNKDDEARQKGDKYLPLGMDMDRRQWERVRSLYKTPAGAEMLNINQTTARDYVMAGCNETWSNFIDRNDCIHDDSGY